MQKFLDDQKLEQQKIPSQYIEKIYKIYNQKPTTKTDFYGVISWVGNNETFSYQVFFLTDKVISNNVYCITIFNNNELIDTFISQSLTQLPPVWDRKSGGIDYYDYIDIMDKINSRMLENSLPIFSIDRSPIGKYIHCISKPVDITIDDFYNNIAKTGKYDIIPIKAEQVIKNE